MTNYREILRLKSMGFNNRQISDSSGATRQTVIAVLQRAAACELDYRSAEALSDRELAKLLLQHHGLQGMLMLMNTLVGWRAFSFRIISKRESPNTPSQKSS